VAYRHCVTSSASGPEKTELLGRAEQCALIDGMLEGARAGTSGVLLMAGGPGIGETALLDYAAGAASGLRVIRVAGVESEMELAFAGLQQLRAPLLDDAASLPEPTRRLTLRAAADPTGDAALLWRACATTGIEADAVGPAQDGGLIQVGTRVAFFHPLVRSAVYRAASAADRRAAHDMLEAMGARSFAGRARPELTTAGATAPSRRNATLDRLTAQESRIAAQANDGLSNAEIAAHLYVSASTVEYHRNKVYRKLGIRSRAQLHQTMAQASGEG
jgi:DNA-binding CsgD family transcriptional regulator